MPETKKVLGKKKEKKEGCGEEEEEEGLVVGLMDTCGLIYERDQLRRRPRHPRRTSQTSLLH